MNTEFRFIYELSHFITYENKDSMGQAPIEF